MRFPDRSREIAIHGQLARRLHSKGAFDAARQSYAKWIESIRQQNENTDGALASQLAGAKREFSEFVRDDPCYLQLLPTLLEMIRATPGILQTDVYKRLPGRTRTELSYVLYFAADHGHLIRRKKGRTYALYEVGSARA